MKPIELKRRYPNSRDEDITDAFMRGYQSAKGELVRCKDCKHQHTNCCPMYHEEWYEIDEGDGYVDDDFTVHDYSTDEGFCSWAKMKGGA